MEKIGKYELIHDKEGKVDCPDCCFGRNGICEGDEKYNSKCNKWHVWKEREVANTDTGDRQLNIPDVVWQSEQLKAYAEYLATRPDFKECSNKDLSIDYCDSL